MNRTNAHLRPAAYATLLLAAAAAALPGCRGERSDEPPRQFLPDMDDQQKFKPQSETMFFADGRSMRPAVNGTVAFGRSANPAAPGRDLLLEADRGFATGTSGDGKYLDYIPESAIARFGDVQKDKQAALTAMMLRGQERFNIYCAACHGYTGEGAVPITQDNPSGAGGMVGRRWASAPPSYHDPKYSDRAVDTGRDGYLFHVVREGVYDVDATTKERKYRMPAYGHAVNPTDAWAIVSYMRAIQASWTTDVAAIPTDKRAILDRKPRPPAPPAPAPAATPAAGAPATKEGAK